MRLLKVLASAALIALPTTAPAAIAAAQAPIAMEAVDRAMATVRRDPQLASEHTAKVPVWIGKSWDWDKNNKPEESNFLIRALMRALAFLTGAGRWLFFAVLVVAFALLVIYMLQNLAVRERWRKTARAVLPTHVRDLDVRPESLPEDIGAAAWGLWERGAIRAALSLLYRGLLSRMVYEFRVPVRDSSTEGDCRELSAQHLPENQAKFAAELIALWQRAIYGARVPAAAQVQVLCRDFASALPRAGAASAS